MKNSFTIIFLLSILIFGCKKILPDLPRDNPLDGKNDTAIVEGVSLRYSSSEVVYDNNGDGIINKGETVYLKVHLENAGTSIANIVKAIFSINSTYVSQLYPTTQVNYGSIPAGNTQYGSTSYAPDYSTYYTIKFTVSSTAPANTQIPININITDEGGNTWNSSFNVIVAPTNAQISYLSNELVYDNNMDDIINKGETVYLKVYLVNNGSSVANGVKATFSTTSSFISQLYPTAQVNYGSIPAGGNQYGSTSYTPDYSTYYTIKFTVSNSTPSNTQIPFSINITDESGNIWTSSFNVTVQGTNANISFSSFNVVYDNNQDGVVNKGETAYLKIYLVNNGSSTANTVKATFSISSSYITQLYPTTQITYGTITPGNTQYGSTSYTPDYSTYYTIKFTASSSTPTNTQIPINVNITDESMNSWSDNFNVTVY